LAAALVFLTGWRAETAFVDPLCGSGVLPIEAAWIALHRPPGLTRRRFGFQGWMDFDVRLWTELRDQARSGVLKRLPAPIVGSDLRHDAIAFARNNARAAGIGHLLHFDVRDVRDFRPPDGPAGVILCNPPYGERIGEEKELKPLYQTLARVFQERCTGWRAFVFTGNLNLARAFDPAPVERAALFNGKIPCRLFEFALS
jgi:putative N6-adenine-specific DNA methylase